MSNNWKPRVLILGPGGYKGFDMLGFLSPLDDIGMLKSIDTICGVSVGSIIALLYIVGYTIKEIINEAIILDVYNDISNFNINLAINNIGLLSNEKIKTRLTNLVFDKLNTIPSLKDLYTLTNKSFITISLNTTDQKCVIMDPFTHPNVSCVDACMYSINVPFIFYQLYYNNKVMIDGAFANPYPINYFDDGNTDILGIYVSHNKNNNKKSTNDIITLITNPSDLSNNGVSPSYSVFHPEMLSNPTDLSNNNLNGIGVFDFFDKIVNYLLELIKTLYINNSSIRCRNVELTTTLDTMIKCSLTINEKSQMLVNGYNECQYFIKNINSPKYLKSTNKNLYTYPTWIAK